MALDDHHPWLGWFFFVIEKNRVLDDTGASNVEFEYPVDLSLVSFRRLFISLKAISSFVVGPLSFLNDMLFPSDEIVWRHERLLARSGLWPLLQG